jgi:hypothetical protein
MPSKKTVVDPADVTDQDKIVRAQEGVEKWWRKLKRAANAIERAANAIERAKARMKRREQSRAIESHREPSSNGKGTVIL